MSVIAEWVTVRHWLLPAIEETSGTHTEDDVVGLLLLGRLRLWIGENYGALTEFIQYPQFKVLNIFLAGGEPNKALVNLWKDYPTLLEYAKANGCKRITCGGREGWASGPSGWKSAGVLIYKDIS